MKRIMFFAIAVVIILLGFLSVAADAQQTTPTHACPITLGFKPSSWAEGATLMAVNVEISYTNPVFIMPAWCKDIFLIQKDTNQLVKIKKDTSGWRLKIWPHKPLALGNYILSVGGKDIYIKISQRQ